MSESPAATSMLTSDGLCGPDELVQRVLAARESNPDEEAYFGDISADGIRRLVRLAYFAGQAPNEGRYPRIRLLVPAKSAEFELDVAFDGELTVSLIQRVAPALGFLRQALLVREQEGGLHSLGIVTTSGALGELKLGDSLLPYSGRTNGLDVELLAPGEVRVSEHRTHRLQSGRLLQEVSFTFDPWFEEWCRPATIEMFGSVEAASRAIPGWRLIPRFAVGAVWLRVLKLAAALHHGACFAILPDPSRAPLRHVFTTSSCDLGAALVACRTGDSPRWSLTARPGHAVEEEHRRQLQAKQRLLSTVETVANLSATDGCVVLNRRLQLHSFGSMIEPTEAQSDVPVYLGDSSEPLDNERLRSFGARRRSAAALCRACPGSLLFVISQDGDLRAFVHRDGAVRLYDHLAYW